VAIEIFSNKKSRGNSPALYFYAQSFYRMVLQELSRQILFSSFMGITFGLTVATASAVKLPALSNTTPLSAAAATTFAAGAFMPTSAKLAESMDAALANAADAVIAANAANAINFFIVFLLRDPYVFANKKGVCAPSPRMIVYSIRGGIYIVCDINHKNKRFLIAFKESLYDGFD
jgi:hypothetical protein